LILVDANILIYTYTSRFPQHPAAQDWFDRQLNGPTRVGLPWASILAFLRVVTNPRVLARPSPTARPETKSLLGSVAARFGCHTRPSSTAIFSAGCSGWLVFRQTLSTMPICCPGHRTRIDPVLD
jgi:predicted nucleic acid-binding protein